MKISDLLVHKVAETKVDIIKKIGCKKLDYEIIKDNFQNAKTSEILDALADSYLKNKTPDCKFKYTKFKRMQEIHALNAERARQLLIRQLKKEKLKTKNIASKKSLDDQIQAL